MYLYALTSWLWQVAQVAQAYAPDSSTRDVYQPLALFLLGIVTSGAFMLMRGDFIGRRAAEEVEKRMNDRIDREMLAIREDLTEIKSMIKEYTSRR